MLFTSIFLKIFWDNMQYFQQLKKANFMYAGWLNIRSSNETIKKLVINPIVKHGLFFMLPLQFQTAGHNF